MFLILSILIASALAESRVLVIDTGMNVNAKYACKDGNIDLTGQGLEDNANHGQIIADIIGSASGICVNMIKIIHKREEEPKYTVHHMFSTIRSYLNKYAPIAVNMSYTSPLPYKDEENILYDYSRIDYFIAAGNDGERMICNVYPACYKQRNNMHIISTRFPSSNVFFHSTIIDPRTNEEKRLMAAGTSFATAIALSRWIKENVK